MPVAAVEAQGPVCCGGFNFNRTSTYLLSHVLTVGTTGGGLPEQVRSLSAVQAVQDQREGDGAGEVPAVLRGGHPANYARR